MSSPGKTTFMLIVLATLGSCWILLQVFGLELSKKPSLNLEFSPKEIGADSVAVADDQRPDNIIIFIADGMGFGHLSLALLTEQAVASTDPWRWFEVRAWHDARSAYGPLTDSEASATAMATGTSTSFGHIGVDPDGKPLQTVFELAAENDYATAIVTDSYIWDGTPAAFAAHTENEDDARTIMEQLAASELDVLFGELEDVGEDDVPEKQESLEILKKRFQLLDRSLALPEVGDDLRPVAVVFEEDEIQDLDSSPTLPDLTSAALDYLSASGQRFVMLVESEELDSAGHRNDSARTVRGLRAIEKTLSLIQEFADREGDTLVLFTGDHETGGLAVLAEYDRYPNLQLKWSTKEHTAALIPYFASGPGSAGFADVRRNTHIGQRLRALVSDP